MRILFIVVLQMLISTITYAQKKADYFIGEWKSYLDDDSTFEYLRLNEDGSGIKTFGKTINGQDTILSNHLISLQITDWKSNRKKIEFKFQYGLIYPPNEVFSIGDKTDSTLTLFGDHFELGTYPSKFNINAFRKSVKYTKTEYLEDRIGIRKDTCLFEINIIEFQPIDSLIQKAEYIGFDDLIPHLTGCTQEVKFIDKYYDQPYELLLPAEFDSWYFGYGEENFSIGFKSRADTQNETCVIIYYDFADRDKNHFLSQIESGDQIANIVTHENNKMYLYDNWQKKSSGQIFYSNHISVAYYTLDKSKEVILQKCISSLRYQD